MAFTEKDMQMAAEISYLVDDGTFKSVAKNDPPPTMRKIVEALRLPNGKFPGKDGIQDFYKEILDPNSEAGDWVLKDVCDNNSGTGMFACAIETEPGQVIVSFRGSESAFSDQFVKDWIYADGGLLNNPLTYQQRDAEEYMRYLEEKYHFDEYYTTGHSLGGNLSMHAVISASPELQDKIVNSYSFDSPGFSYEYLQLHQPGIEASNGKMNHYTYAWAGDLLTQPDGVHEQRVKRLDADTLNGHGLEHMAFDKDGNVVPGEADPLDDFWHDKGEFSRDLDRRKDKLEENIEAFKEEYERTGRWPGGMTKEETTTTTLSPLITAGAAMVVTLRVDPDRLITAARQFESYNGTLGDLTTQMTGLIESLQGTEVWQGEARAAYTGKLAILAGNMTRSRKKISDFVSDLKQIAANYKKAESTNVGSVSPLGTDYIH